MVLASGDGDRPVQVAVDSSVAAVGSTDLLVVDPAAVPSLPLELAEAGLTALVVDSGLDALVLLGRCGALPVVVVDGDVGVPTEVLVDALRRHGSPYVVGVVDPGDPEREARLLEAGASATLRRPYGAADVRVAISTYLREAPGRTPLKVGPFSLDPLTFTVRMGRTVVTDLPLKEFTLLHQLLLHAPGLLPDRTLRAALWGRAEQVPSDNTIAVHVARLRHRIEPMARIRRVRGRGYVLVLGERRG